VRPERQAESHSLARPEAVADDAADTRDADDQLAHGGIIGPVRRFEQGKRQAPENEPIPELRGGSPDPYVFSVGGMATQRRVAMPPGTWAPR
jgi:hypothetical protein